MIVRQHPVKCDIVGSFNHSLVHYAKGVYYTSAYVVQELTDSGRTMLTTPATSDITLRPATEDDAPAMLRLMDIATDWLVKKGQTGQWGTERSSNSPRRIKQVKEFIASGGTWIAMDSNWSLSSQNQKGPSNTTADISAQSVNDSGREGKELTIINGVVGALSVGHASSYIPQASEPELYIMFLITDRASSRKGVGALLLDQARKIAHEAGISLLRLDCYAGGDGGLVRYYKSQGFVCGETFETQGWPGQILMQRLARRTEQNSVE